MRDLLFASLVCRLYGYLPGSVRPRTRVVLVCALIAALLLIQPREHIWICVSLMGCLLRLAMAYSDSWAWLKNRRLRLIVLLVTVAVLKIPPGEGPFLFFLWGITDSIWMLMINYNERIRGFLSRAPMPYLGKLSMGIFVIHTPVYCILRSSLFPIMQKYLPEVLTWLLGFALCVSLSILGAWILHRMYDALSGKGRRRPVSAR